MKMKLLTRSLSLLTIASLTLFFANCGGDDPKTAPEKGALAKLSKTWNIVSADLDGDDRTSDFLNFDLIISGTFNSSNPEGPYDYEVTGNQPVLSPWPQAPDGSGGTWTFGGTPESNSGQIARNDRVGMFYVIDGDQLTLAFTLSQDAGYPASKVSEVGGEWTFVFN